MVWTTWKVVGIAAAALGVGGLVGYGIHAGQSVKQQAPQQQEMNNEQNTEVSTNVTVDINDEDKAGEAIASNWELVNKQCPGDYESMAVYLQCLSTQCIVGLTSEESTLTDNNCQPVINTVLSLVIQERIKEDCYKADGSKAADYSTCRADIITTVTTGKAGQ